MAGCDHIGTLVSNSDSNVAKAWADAPATLDDDALCIDGFAVMRAWERPSMEAMVDALHAGPCHMVCVGGHGRGDYWPRLRDCRPHLVRIVELNHQVAEIARRAVAGTPNVSVHQGDWRETGLLCDRFFLDAHPLPGQDPMWVDFARLAHAVMLPSARAVVFLSHGDSSVDRDAMALLSRRFETCVLHALRWDDGGIPRAVSFAAVEGLARAA